MDRTFIQEGILIREYYASKAMQGLLSNTSYNKMPLEVIAELSFMMADEMIKYENEKKEDSDQQT